jgi:hypothetical protein
MSVFNRDFYMQVSQGLVPNHSILHKFGFGTVGTSLVPVTNSLVYQTPTALTSVEFLSSSINDTSAGSGARTIYIEGIGTGWAVVSETISTNGTTAVALANQYYRIYRWYVATSGTYATSVAGSHAGTLTLRTAGGGATWDTIPLTPFPMGQSLMGCYTVPTGVTAYILTATLTPDTTKTVDAVFFKRDNPDTVSAPYKAMRAQNSYTGLSAAFEFNHATKDVYTGPCDIGFMAKVASGTADVSAEFEMILKTG